MQLPKRVIENQNTLKF